MSESLLRADEIIDEIASGLERELGGSFTVVPQPRYSRSVVVQGSPDLVVRDDETGRLTILEVKVSPSDGELPLATIGQMRRLKAFNRDADANVVLVSTVPVPETVERILVSENISVIRGESGADLVPALRDAIVGTAHV
jgi:hypothetical protein